MKGKDLVPTIEENVRKEILQAKGKLKTKLDSKRSIDRSNVKLNSNTYLF